MEETVNLAEQLWDYYWNYGVRVEEEHRLPAAWAFQVHEVLSDSKCLLQTTVQRRRSLAVWGASQSGKSTLLGTLLDPGEQQAPDGRDGPLSWGPEKGQYALFNKAPDKSEGVGALHINPHNGGLDASGCIARFRVIHGTPAYVDFPQEITLLNEHQILATLAAGYSSEVGKPSPINIGSLEPILKTLAGSTQNTRLHQQAFLRAKVIFEIVRTFSDMQLLRYAAIAGDLDRLSALLFPAAGSPSWLCDLDAVTKLAQKALWDDRPWMNSLFQEMQETLSEYADKRIYCSLSVASYLLDAQLDPNKGRVFQWVGNGEEILLGTDAQSPPPAAGVNIESKPKLLKPEDVRRIQGVVKEILIPLNRKGLRPGCFDEEGADVDVVDIPGVPQQGAGGLGGTALDPEQTRWPRDREAMYTRLVKRGKTLSIVFSLIDKSDLDAMLLVVRQGTGGPIALPNVLGQPIGSWLRRSEQSKRSPLLVGVSFFAECLSSWRPGDSVTLNWSATFGGPLSLDKGKELEGTKVQPFSCPRWQLNVLRRFAGEGEYNGAKPLDEQAQKELLKAIRESSDWHRYGIMQDQDFADQLLKDAFNEKHGGAQRLLKSAATIASAPYEVSDDTRLSFVRRLRELATGALKDVPPAWMRGIMERLQDLQPSSPIDRRPSAAKDRVRAAYAVRRLLSIRPDDLEDPRHSMACDTDGVSISPNYVGEQYHRVVETASLSEDFATGNESEMLDSLGFQGFPEGPRNLLTLLIRGVNLGEVETKLVDVFRDENQDQHRASWYAWAELRPTVRQRLVSIVLEWGIWRQLQGEEASDTPDTAYARHYWRGILSPLLQVLRKHSARPPQQGDDQLQETKRQVEALLESYK